MRINFTGPAMREAEEAALWYWERSGERVRGNLLAEIERVRQILRDQPGIGTPGVRGTRKLRLDKFPYSLVYRIDGDTVQVLAFMHQRRRPEYWLNRR
jgi:plasmid stabilization system protein ParE